MDNETKFKIVNQTPPRLSFNHKSVNHPFYNMLISRNIKVSDDFVETELDKFEIFEGACNAFDFERYHNLYIALQESLAQFGTGLDYVWSKKLKRSYRKYNFVVKSTDGNFIWEVDQDTPTNPSKIYIGRKMIKLSAWLKFDDSYREQLVKSYLG